MKKSLKALRQEWLIRKGLTLRKFCKATGQYFGTVYAWFTSNRVPRGPYLEAVLDVYPDWPH